MHFPPHDGKPARELDLVAQWADGVTTVARIARAEAERDAARAELKASEDEARRALDEMNRRVDVAEAVVAAVRREHNARVAWLASLPPGSCASPPSQALLDAEAATREALRGAL
jgi:multidrug resistance efflux pump